MIPKYQRIADRLRAQLTGENRIRTTKLPTEKELCALYGVSRQTVRQALHVLESEGLIERRQGSGAYATGLHPDASHNRDSASNIVISPAGKRSASGEARYSVTFKEAETDLPP